MKLQSLPVDAVLAQLVRELQGHPCAVLRAPTGSGKTTRVPPAIFDQVATGRGEVLVLEPRRFAARAAARRIAEERGGQVGDEVGYIVRFDQRIGPATRIKIVTDGVMVRLLQDDPYLERVAAVVFDEFHERSLNADLALGMVRRIQQTVRPELKIIIMSATLDAQRVAEYLDSCRIIESEGRLYPVEIRYTPQLPGQSLTGSVAQGVEQLLDQADGDVLVFLPGVGEIRRTAVELASLASRRNLDVRQLYGDLPAEQQDAVLRPSDRRKVVLATNVAETSVTIAGITGVLDTGLARIQRCDPAVGLDRLELVRISRASADQRAGRAGRTQPGVCIRTWSEREHASLVEHEQPEVRRVDLAGPVLQLRCWGEADLNLFPWFEPPLPQAIAQAESLLMRLGALDDQGVTEQGRLLVRLPVHPRLARLMVVGHAAGQAERAALVAALLSERDPFLADRSAGPGQRQALLRSPSDILDRVTALERFEQSGRTDAEGGRLQAGAAQFVLRARDQFVRILRGELGRAGPQRLPSDEVLQRAVLAAFPDRVARRREPGSRRGVMVGGRGVRLWERSAVIDAALFVCVDLDAGQSESLVRQASAVERDWLPEDRLTTIEDCLYDPEKDRVLATRRTEWDGLPVDEVAIGLPDGQRVATVLAEAARRDLSRVLPVRNDSLDAFLLRVRCLRDWMPQLELPALDEDDLKSLLPELSAGCRSFADLRRAPWLDFIKGKLTYAQLQAVDREAPERLEVPSGSRIALQYEPGRPPVLAVRIQEIFGMRETPRIAGGRVPVLLHLLAPNHRPQQVTDDLQSFWNNAYAQVRKDLRRRYPRHAWPEDPWNATPEKRPGRRPSQE